MTGRARAVDLISLNMYFGWYFGEARDAGTGRHLRVRARLEPARPRPRHRPQACSRLDQCGLRRAVCLGLGKAVEQRSWRADEFAQRRNELVDRGLDLRRGTRQAPAHVVWEDDRHLAFLSIFPNTEGFTVQNAAGQTTAAYDALKPEENTTWEVGYKGVIAERVSSWQSEPTSPQLNTNTDLPRRK